MISWQKLSDILFLDIGFHFKYNSLLCVQNIDIDL